MVVKVKCFNNLCFFTFVGHHRAWQTRSSSFADWALCCWKPRKCFWHQTRLGKVKKNLPRLFPYCEFRQVMWIHLPSVTGQFFFHSPANDQKHARTGSISNPKHYPSVTLCFQIKRLHDGPSAVPQTGRHQRQIPWPNGTALLVRLHHPSGADGAGMSRACNPGPSDSPLGNAQLRAPLFCWTPSRFSSHRGG